MLEHKGMLNDVLIKRSYFHFKINKIIFPKFLKKDDILLRDITAGDYISGPKELGVSKMQITQLKKLFSQRKINKILIKIGIPFVPSFFAAFILTVVYGNVFAIILRII